MTPEDELRSKAWTGALGITHQCNLDDALSAIARARQEEREKAKEEMKEMYITLTYGVGDWKEEAPRAEGEKE